MAQSKFELYTDRSGKFRFRIVSADGQVIHESGAYPTKEDCLEGIEMMKRTVCQAVIEDRMEKVSYLMSSMKPTEFILEIGNPIDLGGEIIAQKKKDGSITLYEVVK